MKEEDKRKKQKRIDELLDELEDANEKVSSIEGELYDLGIENPYEHEQVK